MRQFLTILLSVLILAACSVPHSIPDTLTAPANSQNCIYTWVTQPLPELTEKVQAAINSTGLTDVLATVDAYGENCIDPQTNRPLGFSTMETDFHITVQVADLTNLEDLGGLLEKILIVLDAFPTGEIPGPQPGYIAISFQSEKHETSLRFTASAGKSARMLGLHGAALFKKFQKK